VIVPSPVAHLLGGAAVYLAGARPGDRTRALLALAVLGSLAPDFDFVPGILIGDMRAFHHGISHSLGLAAVFGVAVFAAARWLRASSAGRAALVATMAYFSHIFLDLIGATEGTRGVPILWPLSSESFGVTLGVFGHFSYGDISEGVSSVARKVNIVPLIRELSVMGTVVALLLLRDRIQAAQAPSRTRDGRR
jgi:membrane-bound metal-dependent hydrolase YbcI (DUF457 family)